MDRTETAINNAKSAESGNIGYLNIGYMSFAINGLLPLIIKKFNERYPGIKSELIYAPSICGYQ